MMTVNPEPRPAERTTLRQVRLRPASANLYPMLPPGEWLSAAGVATRLLAEAVRTRDSGLQPMRERILSEEHFEFRGGRREVAMHQYARARTRWTDYPSPPVR